MAKEIRKAAYCPNCNKNVPHCRKVRAGFQETVAELLQKLRIGRWHCYHCQRRMLFLPLPHEDAVDYRVVRPSDSRDSGKPEIWSRSRSDDAESMGVSDSAVSEDGFGRGHPAGSSAEPTLNNGQEKRTSGTDLEKELGQTGADMDLGRDVDDSGFVQNDGPFVDAVQGVDEVDLSDSEVVLGSVVTGAIAADKTRSRQDDDDTSREVVEAEPVGNFIKEQSLVFQATRIYRFTEKYRDSVVDRILAGKVNIRELTAKGKYTEAELVSWIADKAKRQNKKIETLELE